jgi:peptide/nickel transport system substrate-binding protein
MLVLLTACNSQSSPPAAQNPAATAGPQGEPKGSLTVVTDLGTERWLLRTATAEAPLAVIGEPMVWWNWDTDTPVFSAILESAESTMNPDKSVDWTWKIRKGVKFQKGWGEVTADDVKFTLTEFLKPGSVNANTDILTNFFGKKPDNIVIVDPYTMKIHEPEAFNQVELFRVMSPVEARTLRPFPKKYFEQVGEEEFAKNPVFAGPYEFVSLTPGYEVVVKAMPEFYRVKPGFAEIHFRKILEESTIIAQLKSGQVDIAAVSGRQVKDLEASGLKIVVSKNASEPFVAFGGLYPGRPNYDPNFPWTGPDPLAENPTKVRKALSLAVDRQAIIDKILFGYGQVGAISFSFLQPPQPWWNPDWKPIPYDVPQAKRLLAEAGYPNCFTIKMYLITGQVYTQDVGEAVASMWEQNLGCKVDRQVGEYTPGLRTLLVDRNTNGMAWSFAGGPIARPERYACLHGGPSYQVVTHTELPFFTELCSISDHTLDINELVKIERQIGDMEYKYYPTVAIGTNDQPIALSSKVKSWTPMPDSGGPALLELAQPN